VLGEQLDLAHLLLPRHEALVEKPAEPFDITLAAESFKLLDSFFTWSTVPASAMPVTQEVGWLTPKMSNLEDCLSKGLRLTFFHDRRYRWSRQD
jgi:hypothetical protein